LRILVFPNEKRLQKKIFIGTTGNIFPLFCYVCPWPQEKTFQMFVHLGYQECSYCNISTHYPLLNALKKWVVGCIMLFNRGMGWVVISHWLLLGASTYFLQSAWCSMEKHNWTEEAISPSAFVTIQYSIE
jgi:hypothetical protein